MSSREGASDPDGWPKFLRDASNNRCLSTDDSPRDEPSLKWTYETGGGIWSSPVVVNGTVYIGSYDNHLYALSADTGEVEWRYRAGSRIDGTPGVSDGTVYFGSHDRNIYALDAETGAERWIVGTKGIVRSSPTFTDDTVYFGAHCNYEVCVEFYDIMWPRTGYLYALDKETGDLNWRIETSTEGVTTTPAIDDEHLYLAVGGKVEALDPDSGEAAWEYTVRDTTFLASPVLADGMVYGASNTIGVMFALDARTGEEQWAIETGAVITGTPAVCDGVLYAGVLEDVGTMYARSAETGAEQWSYRVPAEGIGSSPAISNGVIYFGAHNITGRLENDPGVYAVDLAGEELWSFHERTEMNRGFGTSPAIVDGSLYIASGDNTVYAFDI